MKRFSIVVLLICGFTPINAFAQLFDSYSVAAIGNQSTIIAERFDNFRKYSTGFGVSFQTQKKLSERFGILSGLEISAIRYELDGTQEVIGQNGMPTGETFGDKTTSSLYILSIPIMVNVNGPANFFGYVGPRFDFELGSDNGVIEYQFRGTHIRQEDNLSGYSEFFVAGWSVGLGRHFHIGDLKSSISFRYSGDLSKLVRDDGFMDMKKRRFEILVGIPLFK